MAISSAVNFTVQGNTLVGNTSFIGSRGPNCSTADTTPSPAAFVEDQNTVQSSTIQGDFQTIPDGNSLTCITPPPGGDYWPYGGNPSSKSPRRVRHLRPRLPAAPLPAPLHPISFLVAPRPASPLVLSQALQQLRSSHIWFGNRRYSVPGLRDATERCPN